MTAKYASANDATDAVARLSAAIDDINDWMKASRLQLNPSNDTCYVAGYQTATGQDRHQRYPTAVHRRNSR